MPWPKGKPQPKETIEKRVRSLSENGKTRKKPKIIDGVENWRCSRCKEWKPASAYYASKGSANGLKAQCRVCHTEGNVGTRDVERRRLAREARRA